MNVIKHFSHKGLERFFLTGSKAGIQPRHANRIRLVLAQLHQARSVDDMNIPSLRLHELTGNRRGTWSVTIQANWRITFRFDGGDAEEWITRIITDGSKHENV
ncbi:MAG: type II toxin-antitoxin system RelE/ParE family toxin [Caldilineaceae bacterium]|nr:type II toxin-antitoxin system RelE/ParE family toxin [Caldilineaceae bacterium]